MTDFFSNYLRCVCNVMCKGKYEVFDDGMCFRMHSAEVIILKLLLIDLFSSILVIFTFFFVILS